MNPNDTIKSTSDELNQMGNAMTINSVMAGLIKTYSYVSLHPHTEEVDNIKNNTLNTIEDLVIPLVKHKVSNVEDEVKEYLKDITTQLNEAIKNKPHYKYNTNLYDGHRVSKVKVKLSLEQQKIIALKKEFYRRKFRILNEFYSILVRDE
jgi:hypothetical protein